MYCLRALVLVSAGVALAGCSSHAANKAGGSEPPTVLNVADSDSSDQPDTDAIRHFQGQVDRLSHGKLRIHIAFEAAGSSTPFVEERVIRAVQSGSFDLGFAGARAWDEVGVKSFRALQAPFLITSTRLIDRVAQSPVAAEMLASLSSRKLVGLALVPDYLRHPVGLTHALRSPADFAGARIRIQPSRTTAALIRSFGALPVEISNRRIGNAIGGKRIDGEDLSLRNAVSPSIITGNVTLYPKAITLFANEHSFDALSDDQRRILRAAAASTVRYVAASYPTDAEIVKTLCTDRRRVVLARPGERAALARLAQPLYRSLEADGQTRRLIEQIRALKRVTPPDSRLVPQRSCEHGQRAARATGPLRPASLLDGTYRWVITKAETLAHFGPHADTSENPMVSTVVLRNGTWTFAGSDPDRGTFTIRGNRVRFVWPRIPSILVFGFTRDADGTLHLKPVLPMEDGDQFVWSSRPWTRIGPPTQLEH